MESNNIPVVASESVFEPMRLSWSVFLCGMNKEYILDFFTANHEMFKQYDNDDEHMSYTWICDEMYEEPKIFEFIAYACWKIYTTFWLSR